MISDHLLSGLEKCASRTLNYETEDVTVWEAAAVCNMFGVPPGMIKNAKGAYRVDRLLSLVGQEDPVIAEMRKGAQGTEGYVFGASKPPTIGATQKRETAGPLKTRSTMNASGGKAPAPKVDLGTRKPGMPGGPATPTPAYGFGASKPPTIGATQKRETAGPLKTKAPTTQPNLGTRTPLASQSASGRVRAAVTGTTIKKAAIANFLKRAAGMLPVAYDGPGAGNLLSGGKDMLSGIHQSASGSGIPGGGFGLGLAGMAGLGLLGGGALGGHTISKTIGKLLKKPKVPKVNVKELGKQDALAAATKYHTADPKGQKAMLEAMEAAGIPIGSKKLRLFDRPVRDWGLKEYGTVGAGGAGGILGLKALKGALGGDDKPGVVRYG